MAKNVLLKLGFASVPVKTVGAVKGDDEESELKTLCVGTAEKAHAPTRVNSLMRCGTCQVEKSSHWQFAKGKDNGDGTFTVLTREQLDGLGVDDDVKTTLTITVHKRAEVEASTIKAGRVYYLDLRSDSRADMENYEAVRDAIDRHSAEYAFCIVYAVQSAPAMYEVVRRGDILLLEELAWPNKVNQPPVILPVPYDERLSGFLDGYVTQLVDTFDPATFVDTRRAKIAEFLRSNGAEVAAAATEAQPAAAPANPLVAQFLAQQKAAAKPAKKAAAKKKPAKKPAEDPVPVQPLPATVPDNVDTTLVAAASAPAPKKSTRARKSA